MSNINQPPRDENGKLHGECIWYLRNGELDHRLNYIHGMKYGLYESYYSGGKLRSRGYYYQDKEIGFWYEENEKNYYLCLL